MRPSHVSSSLFLLTSFASTSTALWALTDSPCAVQCGNDLGGTSGSDIVCPDSGYIGTSYSSTGAGQTFSSCTTCQLGSKYVDPVTNQTDLQWALYNLRYAVSYCLFGYPNNTNIEDTPCLLSSACGPLQNAFEFDSLLPNVTAYGYCSMLNSIFVHPCSACLSQQSTEYYLNNFLTALNAACIQQPAPGSTISIQGSLFSTTPINITSPTATANPFQPHHGLTLGTKIGITVAALILLLLLTGFCIICQGRRRRRAVLRKVQRESGYDDWRKTHQFTHENYPRGGVGGGGFFAQRNMPPMGASPFLDSPDSQRPLHAWSARPGQDDSPASGMGEKVYFSPYMSNYSSPVSAHDAIPPLGNGAWPVERKTDIGQGAGEAGRDWMADRKGSVASVEGKVRSREKGGQGWDGEQFEMQDVAPVLMHPGHGRGGSVGLTEEDARRGEAL